MSKTVSVVDFLGQSLETGDEIVFLKNGKLSKAVIDAVKIDERFKRAFVSGFGTTGMVESKKSTVKISPYLPIEEYLNRYDITDDFMTVFDDIKKEMCLIKRSINSNEILIWYFCETTPLRIKCHEFNDSRYLRLPHRYSKNYKK